MAQSHCAGQGAQWTRKERQFMINLWFRLAYDKNIDGAYTDPTHATKKIPAINQAIFVDCIHMWHEWNPWEDDVLCTISRSIGQKSRSHRSFKLKRPGKRVVDHWSTIYNWYGTSPRKKVSHITLVRLYLNEYVHNDLISDLDLFRIPEAIFSSDQAALWKVLPICLSVCLLHLFHNVSFIVSSWSNYQWQN